MLKLFLTLVCSGLITLLITTKVYSQPVSMVYCYENEAFYPHFTGNGSQVPKQNPGAEIEILQQLDQQLETLQIQFVRYPWKRCLKMLAAGKVDAIIASYNKQRHQFAVYPFKKGKLNTKLAYSSLATCFLYQKGTLFNWDGKSFFFEDSISLALPRGYDINNQLKNAGFVIYHTNSPTKAHQLLFNKRVKASIASCDFTDYPDFILKNPIPFRVKHGYLAFSKHFYKQHSHLAKQIWNRLAAINKDEYYQKYPAKND